MTTKSFLTSIAAVSLVAGSLVAARAVPSEITFVNSGGLPTISESGGVFSLDFSSPALSIIVSGTPTGAFASIPAGTDVDWANGFQTTDSGFEMWRITRPGVVFRLDGTTITSIVAVNPGPGALFLEGEGIVHINSHNAPATWSLGIDTIGTGPSTFLASTTTDLPEDAGRVPDVGMTLSMLAMSASGLILMRRRIKAL